MLSSSFVKLYNDLSSSQFLLINFIASYCSPQRIVGRFQVGKLYAMTLEVFSLFSSYRQNASKSWKYKIRSPVVTESWNPAGVVLFFWVFCCYYFFMLPSCWSCPVWFFPMAYLEIFSTRHLRQYINYLSSQSMVQYLHCYHDNTAF